MKRKKFTSEEAKKRNIENYGSKIKKYRMKAGLSAEELAEKLDVSKGSVTNWECGISRPDLENLFRMFHILDVEPNEFFGIGGVGTLLTSREKNILTIFRTLDAQSEDDAEALLVTLSEQSLKKRSQRILKSICPVIDRDIPASAGDLDGWPDPPHDNDRKILLRNDPVVARADEIFTVNGDSMQPQYYDQEKVLVEYCSDIRIGDIGIFNVDKKGLVIKQKAYDRLHSLNEKYDDIFPYEGAEPVGRVIGRVDDYRIGRDEEREYCRAAKLSEGAEP